MKQRSPIAVFFLSLITFGIYSLVWQVKTKGEMKRLGADIPTAWLIIVPFVNIWWLWKYSQGVEKVTDGKLSGVMSFVLLFLLGIIGMAIIQNDFNKVDSTPVVGGTDAWQPAAATAVTAPEASQPQPDNSFGGPVAPSTPLQPATPEVDAMPAPTPSVITPDAPTPVAAAPSAPEEPNALPPQPPSQA